jgi:hypothetical protein
MITQQSRKQPTSRGTLLAVGVFLFLMLLVSNSWRWDSPHIQTFPLLAFLVPAAFVWRSDRWNRLIDRVMEGWRHLENLGPWALGVPCLLATLCISYLVLGPFPHVPDSYSYLFQAKLMAAGRITTSTELNEFFEVPWNVIREGRVFSHYPPGWPALLAVGVLAGVPAAVNPVIGPCRSRRFICWRWSCQTGGMPGCARCSRFCRHSSCSCPRTSCRMPVACCSRLCRRC